MKERSFIGEKSVRVFPAENTYYLNIFFVYVSS
jgi:hypothetical protein